jgi:predicted RNA-binding Zn ribbon-like protein
MAVHPLEAHAGQYTHDPAEGRHGHLAAVEDGLEFINTLEYRKGEPVDHLEGVDDALAWLHEHDLLHREMLDEQSGRFRAVPAAAERAMSRVRRVRESLRELVDATVERRPPAQPELDEVNRALRTHYVYELVPAPDGVSLDHRHEGDPIDGALARLAESIARELSQGEPDRLRVCANDECRWVFKDASRTARRKWCDMAVCGNRAKAARHRQRRRAGGLAARVGDGESAEARSDEDRSASS